MGVLGDVVVDAGCDQSVGGPAGTTCVVIGDLVRGNRAGEADRGSRTQGLLRPGQCCSVAVILASHLSYTMVQLDSRLSTFADTARSIVEDCGCDVHDRFYS